MAAALTTLSTEGVDAAERFAYWREVVCAVYVPLVVDPVGSRPFAGRVAVRDWDDVRISQVDSEGQVVRHSADDVSDECLVSLQVAGQARITQDGRTAELSPGDFALYDATRPYELSFDDTFRQIVVHFPREALLDRGLTVDSTTARRADGTAGLGAVAASFLRSLVDHGGSVPDELSGRLGHQALDCLAAALASTTGRVAAPEAAVAAERQRVLDHIERNLSDPGLSVGTLAARLGRSTRSLQKLFEGDELRLSERIRRARLERARVRLVDPLLAHRSVGAIGASVGLPDPAHFSRVFKARYGCTPTEMRMTSTRSSPPS
ncbi:MAG: helix-turn-helix domain-containing protein [Actinomycetota bacterium]